MGRRGKTVLILLILFVLLAILIKPNSQMFYSFSELAYKRNVEAKEKEEVDSYHTLDLQKLRRVH